MLPVAAPFLHHRYGKAQPSDHASCHLKTVPGDLPGAGGIALGGVQPERDDKEILRRTGREIVITPFDEELVNPNSCNLRLHDEPAVYEDGVLDMKKANPMRTMTIPRSGLLLQPGKLYPGRTLEYTRTESFVPMLEGRSSIVRLGLFIHVTAGFGDVGFAGYRTLEIFCIQPVSIFPNVEIRRIYYHTIEGEYEKYSGGKYQNNSGIQPIMLYRDFEKTE